MARYQAGTSMGNIAHRLGASTVVAAGVPMVALDPALLVGPSGGWHATPPTQPTMSGPTTGAFMGHTGSLIVFEGGDGSGKSTQIALLARTLAAAGVDVTTTREPGGTPAGEQVRELLLDPTSDLTPRTEALLYAAARAQHADTVLRPALQAGTTVLCDRYIASSIAYQGAGRGLGTDDIAGLSNWATGSLHADLTVLLNVDPAAGLARATASRPADRLEAAGARFHQAAHASYRQQAAVQPDRWLVLDGTSDPNTLHAVIADRALRLHDTHRPTTT